MAEQICEAQDQLIDAKGSAKQQELESQRQIQELQSEVLSLQQQVKARQSEQRQTASPNNQRWVRLVLIIPHLKISKSMSWLYNQALASNLFKLCFSLTMVWFDWKLVWRVFEE